MNSAIEGILVAVGTPVDSDQPRALVHCTHEQIQSVERLCMMKPVTIIHTEELNVLRKIESYRTDDKTAFNLLCDQARELRRAVDPEGLGDGTHADILSRIAALRAAAVGRAT